MNHQPEIQNKFIIDHHLLHSLKIVYHKMIDAKTQVDIFCKALGHVDIKAKGRTEAVKICVNRFIYDMHIQKRQDKLPEEIDAQKHFTFEHTDVNTRENTVYSKEQIIQLLNLTLELASSLTGEARRLNKKYSYVRRKIRHEEWVAQIIKQWQEDFITKAARKEEIARLKAAGKWKTNKGK